MNNIDIINSIDNNLDIIKKSKEDVSNFSFIELKLLKNYINFINQLKYLKD